MSSWRAEVQLTLRRDAFGGPSCRDEMVTIGRTSERLLVRAVAGELLRVADEEASMWARTDETLGRLSEVERDRLERILDAVVPDDDPDLSIVPGERGSEGRES